MKFSVEKSDLIDALTMASSIISPRTNLPVLNNVLIQVSTDSRLEISATDLDIGIKVSIQANVESPGGISINSKKLFDFVREIDSDNLEFVVKKNYHAHLSAGNVSARFYGLPEEEFPSMPSVDSKTSIDIPSDVLSNLISLSIFAATKDTTRYELNGILFEFRKDSLRCVASDGKRLSLAETSIDSNISKTFILPLKACSELHRFMPDGDVINVSIGDNVVCFSWGNVEVVSRIIEADYPPYQQVIPQEKEEKAIVDRAIFLSALKRASIFVSSDSYAVRLDFYRNKLILTKDSQDVGSSREEIKIEYPGEDITIGVNPEYLIDMLKAVPLDPVKMELISPDRPIVVRDSINVDGRDFSYMYLVSPMRI